MKILQINKYYYFKGGADAVFFNTIKLLSKYNHEVGPFCTNNPLNLATQYNVYFVDAPEIRLFNKAIDKIKSIPRFFCNKDASSKIEQLILKEKPDIVHIHNIFNGISLSILPILKRYNVPIVITMHDTRFICPSSYFNQKHKPCDRCKKQLFLPCIFKRCYQDNLSNSIMCAMEMLHKEFLFNYDKYIDQYIFLSNAFKKYHTMRHSYFDMKGQILPNFMPILNNVIPNYIKGDYMLYYGRITTEKGVELLVRVVSSMPHIKLIIAGIGPLLDGLKRISSPNIEYVGFVSGSDLDKLIANSSFIIVPSECEENNPLTIIESYAFGKPVIGSRIGGVPEIIEEENTGYIFEPFDDSSLKYAIERAYNITQKEYTAISQNVRLFAEKHFSPEKHYESLMKIYEKAIEQHKNN